MVVVEWATNRAVDVSFHGHQSPDGSRLLTRDRVVTVSGEVVGSVAGGKSGWVWADDSRHLCSVYVDSPAPPTDAGGRVPTELFETLPGSNPAAIAEAGFQSNQTGSSALGCSFGHGSATVGESCVIGLCETWTVDLLSHRVLSHLDLRTAAPRPLLGSLSLDGTLLAVSDANASAATIYRTAVGIAVTSLTGSLVVAFTADDKAVLVTHAAGPAQLLDLRGGVIATLPGNQVQSTVVEPGGSRIAVALGDPGATANGFPGPADLVLVGSFGQLVALAQGVLPQF